MQNNSIQYQEVEYSSIIGARNNNDIDKMA